MLIMFTFIMNLVFIISCVYYLLRVRHYYWRKRNVPYVAPSTIFGNFKEYILLKKYSPLITKEVCEQFPDAPYIGVFYGTDPALIVKDPELIKLVLTKDFYYFHGREITKHTHKELFTQNIFFTQGDKWRVLRQNLTPLFSSSKMKNMFYLIKYCTTELECLLDREVSKSDTVEVKALMSRYTIDTITLSAFGINAGTMSQVVDENPFLTISKKVIEVSTFNGIKNVFRTLWPDIFYLLGFKMFNTKLDEFFHKLLTAVFRERKYEPSSRNDFVDLILALHKNKFITGDSISNLKTGSNNKVAMETNDDFLVSQCMALFAAGFETSSSALTFAIYELAKHEEIQKRAIADVDAYLLRHKGEIEFDLIEDVPYLKACLDEALRLYPLFGTLTREVMEDYTLPTGLNLQEGLRIHIPVFYLHMNADYFPNPKKFMPERFLGKNCKNIKPYTYLSFGEGPRTCIGMRFAKMQVLAGLITILKKYRIKLADGMPKTIQFEPKVFISQPVEDIRLTFIPRNEC